MKKSESYEDSTVYTPSSTDGDTITSQSSYSLNTNNFQHPFFVTQNEATNIDLKRLRFIDPSDLSSTIGGISQIKYKGTRNDFSSGSIFQIKDLIFALTYLGTTSSGIAIGLITYESQKADQWSESLILLGGLVSAIFLSLLLRLGRIRISVLPTIILFAVSICILFSETLRDDKRVWRFLEFITGFASGLEFVLHQIVIVESLKPPWRTILGVLNTTFFLLGFLLVQIFKLIPESHFSIHIRSQDILVAVNIVHLVIYLPITMRLFPETPRYLFAVRDRKTSCVRSIQWLRGKSASIAEEYSEMADGLAYLYDAFSPTTIMTTKNKTFMDYMTERVIILPLLSSVTFLLLTSLTGLQPIVYFFTPDLDFISKNASPKVTILTIAMLLSSIVSSLLINRIGVKSILLISTSGSTASLLFASSLPYFFNVPISNWLAQSTILLFIISHFFGLGALSWTLTVESIPVRGFELGMSLSSSLWWSFLLVFSMTRYQMASTVGVNGIFWLHSVVGILTYLFILFAIPDIKKEDSLIKIQKRYLRSNLKL
ncbi:facilitated trehalose transporter Tret1 [Lepeophtheirus salmonis]|nr:facilitated trehalose transporter Tret1-like [Lepeophtheirus salmonis]